VLTYGRRLDWDHHALHANASVASVWLVEWRELFHVTRTESSSR
jgi:hypothetical protein